MKAIISETGNVNPLTWEVNEAELGKLSPTAQECLVRGDEVVLSWELVLLVEALATADDVEAERLLEQRPAWMDHDDMDVVAQITALANLPRPTTLRLELVTNGRAGSAGYGLKSRWLQPRRCTKIDADVRGGLISRAGQPPRMLSFSQHQVLRMLKEERAWGTDRGKDLLYTAEICQAAREGVVLEDFLAKRDVVLAEAVRPRLIASDNGYVAAPQVSGLSDEKLREYMSRPKAEWGEGAAQFRDEDGQRKVVVVSSRAGDGMRELDEKPPLTPREAAQAMSDPGRFFGDNFDLSELSERVVGFGPPVRRVISSVREMKTGDWWESEITAQPEGLEGEANEETPPSLDLSESGLSTLELGVTEADVDGSHFMPNPDGDGMLVVDDVRNAIELERKRIAASDDEGRMKGRPRDVLQVRENLENVEFSPRVDISNLGPLDRSPPPHLEPGCSLREHQVEGFAWLKQLWKAGQDDFQWRGALLADDMGLGKTIQVLSFLDWLSTNETDAPHLIVAPVGLIENWQQEARKFFGDALEPLWPVEGRTLPEDPRIAASRMRGQRIVLVSYDTLRNHEKKFAVVDWATVILDEAQKTKNPGSGIHRVVLTLKSKFRLAVTGTPVENTLRELWALYDFALPGHLGSLREFDRNYVKPVAEGEATERAEVAKALQARIAPVFLRRMKSQVLKGTLAEKQVHDTEVLLSTAQKQAYGVARQVREKNRKYALAAIQKMLAACAHPGAINSKAQLAPISEESFPKADYLFSILKSAQSKQEKVLVFAGRIGVQQWLVESISEGFGIPVPPPINGKITDSKQRQRMIQTFSNREGFAVLVLSPRAAGVGLNITAANHVIHYMREWNPAVENQATDRAHRMGQTKQVHVHTITATGTVPGQRTAEEELRRLLDEKRALMDQFVIPIGATESQVEEFELGM